MSFKYDLSSVINTTRKVPVIWEKNDRTKYLIEYFISNFELPVCISEIIAWYDYKFEAKLDKNVSTKYEIDSTNVVHGNKIIILNKSSTEQLSFYDFKKDNSSIIKIPFQSPIERAIAFTLSNSDQTPNIFIVITSFENYINNSDGTMDYFLTIFEFNANNWKSKFDLFGHKDVINDIDLLHNDKLVSCSRDTTLRIWDLRTGKCDAILYQGIVVKTFYVLSENLIGSILRNRTVKIWDTQTYECKGTLVGHPEIVGERGMPRFICITSDGFGQNKRFVTMTLNMIKIWDSNTYECIHNIHNENYIIFRALMRVHQSGKIIVTSYDNTIKIFNPITGECDIVLSGHTKGVLAITCMPDGKIASSSHDKTVRIWDISEENNNDKSCTITKCEIISLDSLRSNEINDSNDGSLQDNIIDFLKVLPDGKLIGYSLKNSIMIFK
jgi:WD40 repeat protein